MEDEKGLRQWVFVISDSVLGKSYTILERKDLLKK